MQPAVEPAARPAARLAADRGGTTGGGQRAVQPVVERVAQPAVEPVARPAVQPAVQPAAAAAAAAAVSTNAYLVNPIRDHAYGSNQPYDRGHAGGGLANFSPNLGLPYTGPVSNQVAPTLPGPAARMSPVRGRTFGIAFLSDLEVYLFLTAAQGDVRNQRAPGPQGHDIQRCTGHDLQQHVQYYVQQLIPIVGPGAIIYTPVVGLIPTGQTLTVTPVVSADRRYVRLTMSPFFNALNSIQNFTFGAGAVGGGFGGKRHRAPNHAAAS